VSRFQSQAKMQYYPTPTAIAEAVARSVTRSGPGLIRTIDPACGEGTALLLTTASLGDPIERYGIELNQDRAQTARSVLTRVLRTDIRSTRVANNAFGLVYLNPPYDFDIAVLEEAAQRLELYFLQVALRYLTIKGVLVYLIPEPRLNSKIANILAYQFEHIRVFRFPDAAFTAYRQVVIFAIRKATPLRDDETLRTLREMGIGTIQPPDLPDQVEPAYTVPSSLPVANLLFQSLSVEPEDLVQEIERYGLDEMVFRRLHPEAAAYRMRPLMPLRRGHLALVLASGYLNNELVEDPKTGDRLLVKGRTEKNTVRLEEHDASGGTTITERDVLNIVITALDLHSGELQTMK
jgi:predicted RNA methylase